MLQVTSTQLNTWLAMFMFPLARIVGLLAMAPVFNNTGLPNRLRLVTGLVIALALAPALPAMPAVSLGSWAGLMVLAQELVTGVALGLTLRIVFSAIDIAGELIGMQMGLSFARFYDPLGSGQTPVITRFMTLLALLIFLSMNGHLLTLKALAESFTLLPVATHFSTAGIQAMLTWAGTLFSAGTLLSLPIVTALLIANLALGVLSRVAPSLNIFSIGFAFTLFAGFIVLTLLLPYFGDAMGGLYEKGFSALGVVVRAAARQ
ncbi:MAG: flagellar biosynthetic protein FliR [Proteobacteria bacterium]|nr:flagellar biosynthetic protein FliR [Pseudomonadota bacterium]HQR05004.1 flagellar biosynthetic protein FliR [Rhodocyclaceae bacterium]